MLTYTDRLMQADRVYKTVVDAARLKKTATELDALAAEIAKYGQADSDIGQDVSSLFIRVKAKSLLLSYFGGGYYPDDLVLLTTFIDEKEPIARSKGWINTANICLRLRIFALMADTIMNNAVALIDHVRDQHKNVLTNSPDELRETEKAFQEKLTRLATLPTTSTLFGERVKMPDLVESIKADIEEVLEWCERNITKLELKKSDKFFLGHVRELGDYFPENAPLAEYAPSPLPTSYTSANVVVINTPFEDEALLALRGYAANSGPAFGVVNGADLSRLSSKDLTTLFDAFAAKKLGCILLNIKSYHADDDRAQLYEQLMTLGACGLRVFVVDNGNDRAAYEDMYSYVRAHSERYSAMDITDVYLHMPTYADFILALQNAQLIDTGVDDPGVKEKMPFAGYVGLNAMIEAGLAGNSWRNVGIEMSLNRTEDALDYLAGIPSQVQFIDLGWGEFGAGDSYNRPDDRRRSSEFDYDDIKRVDPKNLKRIVENPRLSIFEKCGGATLYCMLGGMDKSIWKDMSLDEKSERLTTASQFVAGILNNRYKPEVQVITKAEMEKRAKGAGGLCCDGGKQILYREDCVENCNWTLAAVCHECFHGFQHSATHTGWKKWHWEELGVTAGRIDRWDNNNKQYVGDVDSVTYKVEIIESDAVAFEKDCSAVAETALTKAELV